MIKNSRIHKKTPKPESFDRTQVLADLRDMLTDMSAKICKGRVRDKAAFDLKLRALKAFSYGVTVYSSTLDATENEAIVKRLDALEDPTGRESTHDKGKK